ncbi:isoprenoid synthase domain-containing protein, partial [Pisolithus croceorrhizus]
RGKPATHKVYGIPQPTNLVSYVWWLGFIIVAELDIPDRFTHLLSEEVLNLHRGQGLDIFWPDILRHLTEQEYIQVACGKASSILCPSVKIMMAFVTTNTDVDYVSLINLFGMYGQIWDDYMNLQMQLTWYTNAKGLADSISGGRFSFPIIMPLEKSLKTL